MMKNSILFLSGILFLSVTIPYGCQPSATKMEAAEDQVQEDRKDLAESKADLYRATQDSIFNYQQFKIDADQKIIAQEKKIADLKARIENESKEVNDDYNKKLAELENKNSELKKKLADYEDDGQDKWKDFKKEFDHDMDNLGKAYKDLTVDNVN
ncbi:MAG: hypothetical protein R6W31_03235 [Bacteroidales bacterium]